MIRKETGPRSNLALMLIALLCSGCSHAPGKVHDWRTTNIHTVAVVSIEENGEGNTEDELSAVPRLEHQGLDAVSGHLLLATRPRYSPRDVLNQFRRARIDGILEMTRHSSGLRGSQNVEFKYHSLSGLHTSDSQAVSLDDALAELIRSH